MTLALQTIWDYMIYDSVLEKSDCIVTFGSHDLNVARRGAQLYLEGYAPFILFTGGLGRGTLGKWDLTESETFAKIALDMGVPKQNILIENKSTNTGENISFSKELLRKKNIKVKTIIGVQKPFMGRRLHASLAKQWTQVHALIASPKTSMDAYFEGFDYSDMTKDELINIIVGDFIRLEAYAKQGFQIKQNIPTDAWDAFYYLKRLGYTKYII